MAFLDQSATTRLAGVAVASENASRLIAGVRLDTDFPLELGVVAIGRVPTGPATPKALCNYATDAL